MLGLTSEQISAISEEVVQLTGFAYVDDTDFAISLTNNAGSREELILSLERNTKQWQAFLDVTGGSLRPNRCYSYILPQEGILDTTKHQQKVSSSVPFTRQ